jgi:hypothetical protein
MLDAVPERVLWILSGPNYAAEELQKVSPIDVGGHNMPLSSAVRERCRLFLPPGEALRYLFPATSVQLGRGVLGVASFIAITDTQVVVLPCGWFKRNKPKSVWARYLRASSLVWWTYRSPDLRDRQPRFGDRRGVSICHAHRTLNVGVRDYESESSTGSR